MSRSKPKSAMAQLLDATTEEIEASDKNEIQSSDAYDSIYVKDPNVKNNLNIYEEVDPQDCTLWKGYNRTDVEEMGDIDALAHSMKTDGQLQAALVRPSKNKEFKYEIIYGNRRWHAAKKANIKLLVKIAALSDKEASKSQKVENDLRHGVSEYLEALNYQNQINMGIFQNEKELSEYLEIPKQTLNDKMAYVRVPDSLRNRINNYRYLPRVLVIKLAKYSKESKYLSKLIELAPKIESGLIKSTNIDKYLQDKENVNKNDPHEMVEYNKGKLLYTTKINEKGTISIKYKSEIIPITKLKEIHKKIGYLFKELEGR